MRLPARLGWVIPPFAAAGESHPPMVPAQKRFESEDDEEVES
jgi:hypothetical protein